MSDNTHVCPNCGEATLPKKRKEDTVNINCLECIGCFTMLITICLLPTGICFYIGYWL
jgi:hypothetical protein